MPSLPAPFVLSSGMYFLRMRVAGGSNPRRARHSHHGHELLVVEDGRGVQLTRSGQEPCRTGDVFVFPGGMPHQSHTGPDDSFACLVLNAEPGDFSDGRAGDGGHGMFEHVAALAPDGGRLQLRPATVQQVTALLRRGHAEWSAHRFGSACAARALAMEALTLLARDACAEGRVPASEAAAAHHVELAQRWLADNWMITVRIADLVALGPLGRSQFLARFRAITGMAVGDALLAIRLREAQRMLRAGRVTMLDVALACGFGSQSHFNHRFRQATGLSPGAWLRGAQAVN